MNDKAGMERWLSFALSVVDSQMNALFYGDDAPPFRGGFGYDAFPDHEAYLRQWRLENG